MRDPFEALREYAEAERERANAAEVRYRTLAHNLRALAEHWESMDYLGPKPPEHYCAAELRAVLRGDGS